MCLQDCSRASCWFYYCLQLSYDLHGVIGNTNKYIREPFSKRSDDEKKQFYAFCNGDKEDEEEIKVEETTVQEENKIIYNQQETGDWRIVKFMNDLEKIPDRLAGKGKDILVSLLEKFFEKINNGLGDYEHIDQFDIAERFPDTVIGKIFHIQKNTQNLYESNTKDIIDNFNAMNNLYSYIGKNILIDPLQSSFISKENNQLLNIPEDLRKFYVTMLLVYLQETYRSKY